jgi:hypothetical protein
MYDQKMVPSEAIFFRLQKLNFEPKDDGPEFLWRCEWHFYQSLVVKKKFCVFPEFRGS